MFFNRIFFNHQINIISLVKYLNVLGFIWIIIKCLFHFLPLDYWFEFGGYYLFFSTWCIEFIYEKRWKNVKWNATSYYFMLFLLFFAIGIIFAPFDTTKYLKHHIESRYPLLGFGIVGIFGLNEKYSLQMIFKTLILVSTCAILYLISQIGIINLIYSDNRSEMLSQMRIQTINAHMGFNLYLNYSLIAIWYLLFKSWKQMKWQKIVLYIASGVLISLTLFLSEGRSGFLAGVFLLLCFILHALWRLKHSLILFGFLLFPICLYIALHMHPRISEKAIENEARLALWKSAIELIEEKPILGYGISRAQESFDTVNMKYTSKHFNEYWRKKQVPFIDTHNQYIQTTLEFGIIGLILLLAIYWAPIYIKHHQSLLILFCSFLYSFQSLFDIFITGQFCTFFCLIMLTLLRMKDKNAIFSPK